MRQLYAVMDMHGSSLETVASKIESLQEKVFSMKQDGVEALENYTAGQSFPLS